MIAKYILPRSESTSDVIRNTIRIIPSTPTPVADGRESLALVFFRILDDKLSTSTDNSFFNLSVVSLSNISNSSVVLLAYMVCVCVHGQTQDSVVTAGKDVVGSSTETRQHKFTLNVKQHKWKQLREYIAIDAGSLWPLVGMVINVV